jgi:hypothetical protein
VYHVRDLVKKTIVVGCLINDVYIDIKTVFLLYSNILCEYQLVSRDDNILVILIES